MKLSKWIRLSIVALSICAIAILLTTHAGLARPKQATFPIQQIARWHDDFIFYSQLGAVGYVYFAPLKEGEQAQLPQLLHQFLDKSASISKKNSKTKGWIFGAIAQNDNGQIWILNRNRPKVPELLVAAPNSNALKTIDWPPQLKGKELYKLAASDNGLIVLGEDGQMGSYADGHWQVVSWQSPNNFNDWINDSRFPPVLSNKLLFLVYDSRTDKYPGYISNLEVINTADGKSIPISFFFEDIAEEDSSKTIFDIWGLSRWRDSVWFGSREKGLMRYNLHSALQNVVY